MMSNEPGQDGSLEGLAADLATTPYEPLQLLARGGMGEVVIVEHRELGRKLVMKLLRSNLQGQEQLAERMRAEARMLARLSHPNLVGVVDSGRTARGRPFLVTELLEGETLSDYVTSRGGHLSIRESLTLAMQVLAGLSVVHEAGFVHRDLKPANLFVVRGASDARRIKILDFGIAKALSEEDRRALGLVAPTTEGAIMGTPSFVSPEQVQSGKVDARTDVYGLGVVVFRIITGRPPFTGDALALFRAHLLEKAPPASSLATQPVPPSVDAILAKALEKEPAKRFQSASEMASAIERALVDLDLESETTDDDTAGAMAATVEASQAPMTVPSPIAPGVAPRPDADGETTTRPFTDKPAGGTAVIPTLAANAMGALSTPSPVVPVAPVVPIAASVAAQPPARAELPRKTELIRREVGVAPRDTVKLDAPEALDSPWKSDAVRPRRSPSDSPRPRVAAPRPRSWLSAWGPILAAIIAATLVLLALFAWRHP